MDFRRVLNGSIFCLCFLFSLFFQKSFAEKSTGEIFSEIYEKKLWGLNHENYGTSGPGSSFESTEKYREFLQHFLHTFDIHSVVDVGCGDWEFSRFINWDGINYMGYDVVPRVIEENKRKYETAVIQFAVGDGAAINLPVADLLICKDVLMHLPYEDIAIILSKAKQYKYCLFTNDIIHADPPLENYDIVKGDWRPSMNLAKPPFNLKDLPVLHYSTSTSHKEVYLIVNDL
jgi:SAM-dependent methyltransferase